MSKRNIRKRKEVEEDSGGEGEIDGTSLREKLESTKGLQKYRQRSQGLASDSLAGTSSVALKPEGDGKDSIGGYIKEQTKEEAVDLEREKYIREQLDKRLGGGDPQEEAVPEPAKPADMYAIPAALRTQKVNQEDVSAWMTGIVEVPLSMAHKLKNAEETEVAKKRLLEAAGGVMPGYRDGEEPSEEEENLRRITYPFRFGQQTAKEEAWRQSRIQKPQQPREWKKKKRGGA